MSERKRRVLLAIGWGMVIGWLPMAIAYVMYTKPSSGADFGMFYTAAETLRFSPHSDVYLLQTLSATELAHGGCAPTSSWPFLYPYQPLFAMLLEPLTLMPCQDAAMVWRLLNFALWFGVAGVYAFQAWRRHGSARALAVAMVTVFFAPVMPGIFFGQIHLVLLVCLIVGITLVERDHDFAGGAMLAFGAVLKYFPAFLVFYYLLRGRWRVAGGAVVISIALLIAQGLVVGPQRLLESVSAGAYNVRLGAALYQGGNWMRALPGGEAVAYLAFAIFVMVVLWLRWRHGAGRVNDQLGAGWAIATMLLISPLVWWFDMTWLLPAFIVCLNLALQYAGQHASDQGWLGLATRWGPLAVLVMCYLLLVIPPYDLPILPNYLTMTTGTLLLWLLCGAFYLRSAEVRIPGDFTLARMWRRVPSDSTDPALVVVDGARGTMR